MANDSGTPATPADGRTYAVPPPRELKRERKALLEVREDRLRDLGGLALEMYKRDSFEGKLLWGKAAEVAAIDDETKLVKRGLEEGLTLEQLEQVARGEAHKGKT
jgi:hypothetical protein